MHKALADVEHIEKFLIDHYLLTAFASADNIEIGKNIDKAHALNTPYSCYKIANHYRDTRKFDDALVMYEKAYDLGFRDTLFLREAGECMLRHGSFERYCRFYRVMRKREPDNRFASFVLETVEHYQHVVRSICSDISTAPVSGKTRLILQTTFWGERFVDIFLNYTVPILIAEKNLPAVAQKYEIHYLIATTTADVERMQSREMYARLLEFVHIHFVELPDKLLNYSYEYAKKNKAGKIIPISLLTNAMHYAAIECSRQLRLDLVMVYPDHIVSDSFLTDLLAEKKDRDVISGVCFRLCYDTYLLEEINSHRNERGILAIDYRRLYSLLFEYLPEVNYVNSATCFTSFPVYVCWKVANRGLIAHVNHYCVWLLSGEAFSAPVYPSLDPIDGFFLDRHIMDTNRIGLASEKVIGFDLGDNPLVGKADGTPFDIASVASWLKSSLTDVHRKYFENCMRYSLSGSFESEEWEKTKVMAKSAVNQILMLAKHS